MLNDKEIINIAQETYYDFLTDYLVEAKFDVLTLDKYLKFAEKNEVAKAFLEQKITKIKDLPLPILICGAEKERIFLSKTIIARILKKVRKALHKDFIRAIVLHELYHLMFEDYERNEFVYSFLMSTKRANKEFKDDYPDLAKVLDFVSKRFK